jgi:pyrroline-5-carboxylate reductase
VVSFVATVPITQIANLVAPAKMICRATPLTTIEKKRGPVVVAPANAAVEALFDGLGDVIVADTEDQMMAFGSAAAMVSTFHELEHTVAQWLSTTGVNPASASLYVRSMFAGIANSALENRNLSLSLIADSNETPGGLNERVRRSLRDAGMFTRIERTLSELSSLSLVQPTNCEPTRDESHAGH